MRRIVDSINFNNQFIRPCSYTGTTTLCKETKSSISQSESIINTIEYAFALPRSTLYAVSMRLETFRVQPVVAADFVAETKIFMAFFSNLTSFFCIHVNKL